jgi:hypothetical protein
MIVWPVRFVGGVMDGKTLNLPASRGFECPVTGTLGLRTEHYEYRFASDGGVEGHCLDPYSRALETWEEV